MKNYYNILFLMILSLHLQAQTPRLVLYELFTGETCPPTAATNPALNALLAQPANVAKMVTVNWEVPIPMAPTPTWSLYKTNKTEIDWRYKPAPAGYGYSIFQSPLGLIDGQSPVAFGGSGIHPATMNSTVIATAQSYTSAFSVTMAREWDATFSSINLTISITASANFTAVGALVFRTVMIERNVDFPVAPGTTGEKHFEHVAIRSFPSIQTGVPMSGTWITNQNQTFTLNCVLPSYVRDKSEVGFVGFIQDDGNRRVAQSVKANPERLDYDIKAVKIRASHVSCMTSPYSPTLLVQNTGTNTLNSFTIVPIVNGTTLLPIYFAGSILPGDTANVFLGQYSTPPVVVGNNTLQCEITMLGDNNVPNNKTYSIFNNPFPSLLVTANSAYYCVGQTVNLYVTGASSYTWNGTTLGNWLSFTALSSGNVTLVATSSIANCQATLLYSYSVSECNKLSSNYNHPSFSVFPNPCKDLLRIESAAADHYMIFDGSGRQLMEGKLQEGVQVIDVSVFTAGFYFLNVSGQMLKIVKE